jgi:hypothetical protein
MEIINMRYPSALLGCQTAAFGALLQLSLPAQAQQQAQPKELSEASVVNEAHFIKEADLTKLSKPFEVSGLTRFDGWFIVADKVIFKSGSQLIFTRQALQNRRNFYIVAKELVSEDANAPGTIAYERPPSEIANAKSGQAPSGTAGQSDGSSGSVGASGEQGSPGPKGFSAPSITLTLLSVPGSGPIVDLRGALGGTGGQGQKGGDGGAGAKGSPASESVVDCKAGGGRGGNGGRGGAGGSGGVGGTGGDGGTVTIITPDVVVPSLAEKFRVLTSAGIGGQGGAPGIGGNGGAGGPGGQEAKPYCGGGPGGNGGGTGIAGVPGNAGVPGTDGDFLVGTISRELFAQIYK